MWTTLIWNMPVEGFLKICLFESSDHFTGSYYTSIGSARICEARSKLNFCEHSNEKGC